MTEQKRAETAGTGLAKAAVATMQIYFRDNAHTPGPQHWEAITHILNAMSSMANGKDSRKVYVSAMEPGCGKTTCVVHFAKALVNSTDHRAVGMIIFVGRVSEAVTMAKQMAVQGVKNALAVWTSDEAANVLGGAASHDKAQILITTHARADLLLGKASSFDAVAPLHYQGRPRKIRAWDEAYMPGRAVAIAEYDLLATLRALPRNLETLQNSLRNFANDVKVTTHNSPIAVPEFEQLTGGIPLLDLADSLPRSAGSSAEVLRGLAAVGGSMARVSRVDGLEGTLVSYGETRPVDFAPVVVLDASARVRHIYRDMAEHRGNIVNLGAPTKDYSPLTIHVRHAAAGREAFSKQAVRNALAQEIAALIHSRPNEKWLVVAFHPRRGKHDDMAEVLRPLLGGIGLEAGLAPTSAAQVHVITWGNHMATNAFRDFPNVILAGVLCPPRPALMALTHMAQKRDVAGGLCSDDEVTLTRRGEYADVILQAINRGCVRRLAGDKCPAMNAYLIAAPQTGIAKMLPEIFPGCTVRDWGERKHTIPPCVSRAIAFLEAANGRGVLTVTYKVLQDAAQVTSKNFSIQIINQPAWQDALGRLGWAKAPGGRSSTFMRVVTLEDLSAAA